VCYAVAIAFYTLDIGSLGSMEGTTMNAQIPQGLKITFLIHFLLALLFGLSFLLIPTVTGGFYGLVVQEEVIYRLLGGAMLGFGISSWLSYKATDWESVRIIVLTEIFWTILGTIVLLYALLFAGFPTLGWLNVVIFAAFAIAFGWFYFQK
jgi:hypothetical protein